MGLSCSNKRQMTEQLKQNCGENWKRQVQNAMNAYYKEILECISVAD